MQIRMSVTESDYRRGILDSVLEEDCVIVKMNMPRRFKSGPSGIQSWSHGLTNTKTTLRRDLVATKSDKDSIDTHGEFATITVNLLSQPEPEGTDLQLDKHQRDGEEMSCNTDHEITTANEDEGSEGDDEKLEDISESEDSDDSHVHSSGRTKTPSAMNDTLAPLELPNISLPCSKCSLKVNICHLRSHRDFHSALQTFQFAQNFRPRTMKTLVKRRKLLIRKLQEPSAQSSGKGFVDKNLQKINRAFEILKSDLKGTGNSFRVLKGDLDPAIKDVYVLQLSCTTAVGVCEERNSRWKNMEDAHAYQDNFLENQPSCFMGVYDGYCGNVTAQKCAKFLHVFLKAQLEEQGKQHQLTKEVVATAFKQAYCRFQKMLMKTTEDEEQSRSRWSGCSALTFLMTSDTCYLANAGDVGALLVRANGLVKVLASKHDLYNKKERDRVRKSNGVIVKTEKCALINGALGTTRGLGNIGDKGISHCVINEPKFKCVKLFDSDQIVVLASSGLWKMFSYDETSHLIFGFFRKIKRDIIEDMVYGDRIPSLRENGLFANEHEEVYERLAKRNEYFKQFLRPKTSRHSSVGFVLYFSTIQEESQHQPTVRALLNIPHWSNHLGRRMSDTCLSYPSNGDHSNENEKQPEDPTKDDFEPESRLGRRAFKRRHSLPDKKGLCKLHQAIKTDFSLTKKDKEKLVAKYLARRLVKSAILAGSLDNVTVLVTLLKGFNLVNVNLLSEQFLGKLDR